MDRHNSSKAVEELRAAQLYELGTPSGALIAALNVLYLRGYAYRERIARLHASGASIREISAQLEVSTATIHKVLRRS